MPPRAKKSPAKRRTKSPERQNGASAAKTKQATAAHGSANGASEGDSSYAFDEEPMQFGGTVGAACIIGFSHFLLYYLYLSVTLHGGALFLPVEPSKYAAHLYEHALPTAETVSVYAAFIALQTALALFLPGLFVEGLPVKSLGGKKLTYNCNGYGAWVATQALVFGLHQGGVFRIQWIVERYGALMTTMIILGDLVALCVYACAFLPRVVGEGHAGAFRKELVRGSHRACRHTRIYVSTRQDT